MNYWLVNTDRRTLMGWDANGWTRLDLGEAVTQGDRVVVYLHDTDQFVAVGKVLGGTDRVGVSRVEPVVLFDFDWVNADDLRGSWTPFDANGALPLGVTEISAADYEAAWETMRPLAEAAGLA